MFYSSSTLSSTDLSATLMKYYCIMDTLENHLLGKFPICWRPFLRVLRSQRSDVKILEHFLPRRLNLQTANDNKDHIDCHLTGLVMAAELDMTRNLS
ncbi:hypothetical protein HOLleu_36286 [Holothuria leucospilota]|uniref:Uncharacterized protein n=1 Tax=Holothuria leucospilota TaxID=206669 RepID=A0A9Q0YJX6_HOLLE|nr:hypothetical protein HOLleu_36286 [Holothuria leucospilota]